MVPSESSTGKVAIVYTTREAVKAALDIAETVRANAQIDRAMASATEAVEGGLHRSFRPVIATKRFPYPNPDMRSSSWRLPLDGNELISLTSLTVGGDTISTADVRLEPDAYGPPYQYLEMDLAGTTTAFYSGDSFQRSIVPTGLWGYQNDTRAAGTTAEALDATETGVDVTDGSLIGVGDVLVVGSEYLNVTGRTWLDTTENLAAGLTSAMNDQTIAVTDGTTYTEGELVKVNSETMEITAVAGNNLTVTRAVDGSVLAVHAITDDIYAHRTLTVERGALGSTADTHLTGATLTAHVVPPLVETLTIALTLVTLGIERSGGASTSGSGNTRRNTGSGDSVEKLWERAQAKHGRLMYR
ncbi:MAG: hypothetical protein GY925_16855 [Actinomycetia bacterium]|nr:hypothetical protein [Actinomycetes bacterium]